MSPYDAVLFFLLGTNCIFYGETVLTRQVFTPNCF